MKNTLEKQRLQALIAGTEVGSPELPKLKAELRGVQTKLCAGGTTRYLAPTTYYLLLTTY